MITKVNMTNADITGSDDVGGIVARLYNQLTNSYIGGTINGGSSTGRIVGYSNTTASPLALRRYGMLQTDLT